MGDTISKGKRQGINLGPQELLDKLASFDTEAEAVQWAKDMIMTLC